MDEQRPRPKDITVFFEDTIGKLLERNLKGHIQHIEQYYGLCGRGRGWEDLGEWH